MSGRGQAREKGRFQNTFCSVARLMVSSSTMLDALLPT
ncbi:unnamed protein product [Ixodes persulcatus]